MNSNLLKIFNEQLTNGEKQWYHALAGYLISKGKTASLSSATLTKELVENGLIEKGAARDNNPSERFLNKLEDLGLISIEHKRGRGGNKVTLNFYVYTGQPLEGIVPWQHPLYMRRNGDRICEECLVSGMMKTQSRVFLKIKSPRYTGKTSLLIRLKEFAKAKNAAVGFIDLESYQFSDELFQDGKTDEENKQKYKSFLNTFQKFVQQEFKADIKLPKFNSSFSQWGNISLAEQFTRYLEEEVFARIEKPKVLFIDGIDRILGTPIQDPFLRILRTWVEQKMKMLGNDSAIIFPNIIIAFSTESYFDKESPLQNVGTDIELGGLIDDQVLSLAQLYGLVWDNGSQTASRLRSFLGGNPYLINTALYEMTKKNFDLDTLQQQALFPNSHFLKHLNKIVEMIKECEGLEATFSDWLKQQDSYLDEKVKIQLAKLGAIEFEFKNNSIKPTIPCQLYEQYFKQQFFLE